MNYDSRNRLARLEQIAQLKGQAARDAQSRRNNIIGALTAARAELKEAEAQQFGRASLVDAVTGTRMSESQVDTRVDRLAARVAELAADQAAADEQAAATRDAATDAGRLLGSCVDFARANGLPLSIAPRAPGADPKAHIRADGAVR
jgi:hypothetical protein